MYNPSCDTIKTLLIIDLKNKNQVKTRMNSDFTNYSANDYLKLCVSVLMVHYLATDIP